jgi:predicted DCC family thiol-disulfide oxidoreductase YuxK
MSCDKAEQDPQLAPLTVWYDGGCPMCRQEMRWLRGHTGSSVSFVDLTTATALPVARTTLMQRLHAQEQDGPLLAGVDAFAALWQRSPIMKPLGAAIRYPGSRWILTWAYEVFLRIRPRLQRVIVFVGKIVDR